MIEPVGGNAMPSEKFTAKTVEAYSGTGKQVDYFDTADLGCPGSFGLRVSAKGQKSWFVMYRMPDQDKRKRFTLKKRYPVLGYKVAKKEATIILNGVADGIDPAKTRKEKKESETFSDCWQIYLKMHALKKKKASSVAGDKGIYERDLKKSLGPMKMTDISRKHVVSVLDEVAERGNIIANRTQALISIIFTTAVEREIVESNPCYKMHKRGGKETSRTRVLSKEEIRAYWFACERLSPKMRDIFRLRLLLAQRNAEIVSMRFQDIEGDVWTIPASVTKNSKEHRVPLPLQALDIIKGCANESEWVFPSSNNSRTGHVNYVLKAGRTLKKEAGLQDFRGHDARRTAATMMAESGVSDFIIGKVLNHTDNSVTAVYNRHAYDEEKRRALEKWANRLDQILHGKQAKIVNLR